MNLERLVHNLLTWYDREARDLPWRRLTDPYAVWVSEIMLQQTQVDTVVPYFDAFMHRFPDVATLARARLDTVLKQWQGLGYYRRARNLHEAARQVVKQHGGELPDSVAELKELPGIGRYTAGAIASIAFGKPEPVLDGNVERVLCRIFRIRENPRRAATRNRLWEIARDLIPDGKASQFNQALMDLGATVCTPRKPDCPRCPVSGQCQARRHGEQIELPKLPPRGKVPHVQCACGVVLDAKGRVLIDRREPDDMLGGMWEFPGGGPEEGEALEDCVKRELLEETGIVVEVGAKLAEIDHAYTHFTITLHAWWCRHVSGRARAIECDRVKWVAPEKLERYAFPKASLQVVKKVMRELAD